MSCDELLVNIENVSKCFQIFQRPADRLKQSALPRIRKIFGLAPKSYMRQFWALQDVTFEVKRGETVGIIGRNGSGKSTLLQLICGTLRTTGGQIKVNGRIAALLELGAGFNPEFSGRENVFVSASIAGMSQNEIEAHFAQIEAFADIGEFIDQPVKTYSSGMFVRLAFATAIHTHPDLLVVDEALAVGDTAFQTKCLTRIRELQKQGVSILLVTHSTNTLLEYCDRAIYLKRGRKVLDGPCREIVKRYADDLVEEEGGIAINGNLEAVRTADISDGSHPATEVSGPRMAIERVQILDDKGLETTTFSLGDRFSVLIDVAINERIKAPCFGMQIKSTDDIVLWSGTSHQMGLLSEPMECGRHRLTWTCCASFSGNRYVIAIGCGDIETGEYKRHARLPYAGHIDVLPEEKSGYGWLEPKAALSSKVIHGD